MDGGRTRARLGVTLVLIMATGLTSCAPRAAVEDLPTPEATLAGAGTRLSRKLSAGELTALATRGDRVLAALTRVERDALARGALRFRVDRPAVVCVAAPRGSAPFWLADLGFTPDGSLADGPGLTWDLYRKTFAPGRVGLGVNGLDRTPPAHYAVFVRSADGGPLTLNGFEQSGWESVPAEDGVSLERGEPRPLRGLPGSLRGATLLRQSHDRRHATLLARGRVWKTHIVAAPTPDQVTVAFGADPSSELVWSWRTAPEVARSVVRVRKAGSDPRTAREVSGDSATIATPDLLNDPLVRRHTVRVSGLEPATAYDYALGNGSTWATVRTAPRGPSDVSLLYLGDPQCGLEGWGKLLAAAHRRHPDVSAVLIAGDLVDRGNERTNWDHFFLRASGVFDRVPVMPCVGNHEYLDRGPRLYRAFFALPANGPPGIDPDLVYSVEVGDAFIAVLDSTLAVSDPSQALAQARWLDERLAATRRAWKLVMFHHPVYASHPARESPALRDAWVPVFDRHRVDLVLQGHDHAYLRTYPLRENRRAGLPSEGTVYVVSVSGDKYYDLDPRDYTEVAFTHTSTYQTIDLTARDNRLLYRAFDASGRERDRFEVRKPRRPERVASQGIVP